MLHFEIGAHLGSVQLLALYRICKNSNRSIFENWRFFQDPFTHEPVADQVQSLLQTMRGKQPVRALTLVMSGTRRFMSSKPSSYALS